MKSTRGPACRSRRRPGRTFGIYGRSSYQGDRSPAGWFLEWSGDGTTAGVGSTRNSPSIRADCTLSASAVSCRVGFCAAGMGRGSSYFGRPRRCRSARRFQDMWKNRAPAFFPKGVAGSASQIRSGLFHRTVEHGQTCSLDSDRSGPTLHNRSVSDQLLDARRIVWTSALDAVTSAMGRLC